MHPTYMYIIITNPIVIEKHNISNYYHSNMQLTAEQAPQWLV